MKPLPISKAPTDGTLIILMVWTADGLAQIDVGCWGVVENADWESGTKDVYGWQSNDGEIDEPTHYLPMFETPDAIDDDSSEDEDGPEEIDGELTLGDILNDDGDGDLNEAF